MNLPPLKHSVAALGLALMALSGPAAHAAMTTVNFDMTGAQSIGLLNDPANEVRSLLIASGVQVVGLSWNVTLATFGTSWLSEMGVDLSASGGAGVQLFPGFSDNFSGSGTYAGSVDLAANNLDFFLGQDGLLTGRFFELFDDAGGGNADGVWRSGSVSVQVVPEPASYGLAALALMGLALTRRRRR